MNERAIRPEEYFHLRDGRVLKDLKELMYALKGMDDHVFSHHITQDRNDFGNWILHVFKEPHLAEQVFRSKTKEEIIEALEFKIAPSLEQMELEDHHKEHREKPKGDSTFDRISRGEPSFTRPQKIETKEPPRRFDFREQMVSQFQTIKEAFQKTKQEVGREGILLGEESEIKPKEEPQLKFEPAKQEEKKFESAYSANLPPVEETKTSADEVVDPDDFFGSKNEPDLNKIVQEMKKRRGRPRKDHPEILTEPDHGTDVSALSKASELVKAFPFERTTAGAMNEAAEAVQKTQNEILEKEKENSGKIDELLLHERELELREQKIIEIEERLEKELMELANKKDPSFFTKDFIHGLAIGLLAALIVGLIYIKFWG